MPRNRRDEQEDTIYTNTKNSNNSNNSATVIYQTYPLGTALFLLLWILLGVAAWVKSFMCAGPSYEGDTAQKVVMFITACIFGPFWWLFYWVVQPSGYCKAKA